MKRTALAIGILLLALGAVVVIPRWREPREPQYQGRSLRKWLDRWESSDKDGDSPEAVAIKKIGTNALPVLLTWVPRHNSALKSWWMDAFTKQDWVPYHPAFAPSQSEYAVTAFEVLGTNGAPAVPGLLRLLHQRDSQVRADAALCLGEIADGAKAAVSELSGALGDKDDDVRAEAAWALGNIHGQPEKVVPRLLEAFTHNQEPSVCAAIVTALGNYGPDASEATPRLLKLLNTPAGQELPDEQVRSAAVYALGEIGANPAEAVPVLIGELRDPDAEVRSQAAQGLGKFGTAAKEAIPALIRLLPESSLDADDEEDMAELRGSAAEALGEIGCDPATVVPALIATLRDSDAAARQQKVEALGSFGTDAAAALPPLKRLLEDDDAQVRESTTNALREIRGADK